MQRTVTFSLVLATLVGIVAISVWQARRHLPTPTELAAMLQQELAQQLKVPVRIGQVKVGWWGATVHQVHILPDGRSPTGYLLTVPKLQLRWSWRLLLSPSRWRQAILRQLTQVVQQVVVADARLFLWRDRKGRWNVNPLLSVPPTQKLRLPVVTFQRSELMLSDELFPLPDGTPFRLHLVDAEGKWRRDVNGSALFLQGKIAVPLGTEKSAAKVTITERVGEQWRERKGSLHFTGLQADRLPERLRRWVDGRLTIQHGDLVEGEVHWVQQGQQWQVRFTLLSRHLLVDWQQNRRVTSLRLREATLHGALRMDGKKVRVWRLTLRWRPQPLLGEAQLTVEGNPAGWRVQGRGRQISAPWLSSVVSHFGLASLPLTQGSLSGTVTAEGQGKAWRVETEWVGEGVGWQAQSFAPFLSRIAAAFPFVNRPLSIASITTLSSVKRMHLTARMEGVGRVGEDEGRAKIVGSRDKVGRVGKGKWRGTVNFSAIWERPTKQQAGRQVGNSLDRRLAMGDLSLKVVWQDGEGRAEGRTRNFPLGRVSFHFPVPDKPLQWQWVGGFVSGEGIVRWHRGRLQLERLALQLTDGIVRGDSFAPMQVAFSLCSDGNRITIPKAQLRWRGGAMMWGEGEVLVGRPMVWQAEGTLSGSAVTSLSAWLYRRWTLPLQLFASGPLRVKGRGVDGQWLAEGQWTAPQGAVVGAAGRQRGQWGLGAEQLNAFIAPQGAIFWGPLAQLTPPSHAIFASSTLRLSDWQLQWDAKERQVTASGTVFMPYVTVLRMPLQNVKGQVSVTVRGDGQGWQLWAQNLSGEALQGEFSNGQLVARGDGMGRWQAISKGQAKGVWLSEIQRLRLPIPLTLRGKFTGQWQGQGSAEELRLAVAGDITDAFVAMKGVKLLARKVQGLNGAVILVHRQDRWHVDKVVAETTMQAVEMVTKEGEEWQAERLVVQGVAERDEDDGPWRFDGRLLQGRWLGGQISGQLAMDGQRLQGHVNFTALDGERLLRFVASNRRSSINLSSVTPHQSLPFKGRVGGWLRFQLVRRKAPFQGPEGWQGEWDGALSLSEGAVGEWVVKLAGLRGQGQIVAEVQQGRLAHWRTKGEVDGFHLISPDGQAVLRGSFTVTNQQPSVDHRQPSLVVGCRLQGRWGMVSLRRLAERFGLPKPLQGVAEGTVSIHWDGDVLQTEGTVRVPAVVIGEGVRLTEVTGEWSWQPNTLRLRRIKAQGDGGVLTAEGTFGTVRPFPLTLRVESEGISSSVLRAVLQEWRLPISDWAWQGRVGGMTLIYWDANRQQITAQLTSPAVTVGGVSLGVLRVDVSAQRDRPDGEWYWRGSLSAHRNGMAAQMKWDGTPSHWHIAWRAGQLPLEIGRAVLWAILPLREDWQDGLRVSLTGNLWTEGEGQFQGRRVKALRATVSAPRLWGIGEEPFSLRAVISHDGRQWLARPVELRQQDAHITGWIAIGEKEALDGELTLTGVRRRTIVNVLQLLGVRQVPSLPDGIVQGQLHLAGTLRRPEGTGSLQVREGRWAGWRLPQLVVRRFVVDREGLRVAEGDGEIHFDGKASPARFWGEWRFRDGGLLRGHLSLPRVPLDALVPPEAGVQIRGGWLQGEWDLQGTTEQPYLVGSLEGSAQAVHLSLPVGGRQTLRQVRWRLTAEGATVRLEEASAQWKGGTITASGFLTLQKGGWQNPLLNEGEIVIAAQNLQASWNDTTIALHKAALRLSGQGKGLIVRLERAIGNGWNAEGQVHWQANLWQDARKDGWQWLSRGNWDITLRLDRFHLQRKGANGQLSGSLRLYTPLSGEVPLLSGNLTLSDGNVARLAVGGGEARRWELPPAVRLAVTVRVGDGLFLRNLQATVLLSGSVRLTGTLAQPRLEGEIQGRTGTVRLPASTLTLTEMTLPFTAFVDPLSKGWQWTARLRVEGETQLDIHRIIFIVSGPVDEQSQRLGILPTVTILATPPLPERTVLERLFGASLAQLSQVLTDWQQLFSGALVQSFMGELLAPVTTPIAEALRLSELSLVREQKTGQRWLRLGFPLSPRLHIFWRQGLSAGDPSAFEVQYFLGKRTSITWVKREREQAEIRLQTSVRF